MACARVQRAAGCPTPQGRPDRGASPESPRQSNPVLRLGLLQAAAASTSHGRTWGRGPASGAATAVTGVARNSRRLAQGRQPHVNQIVQLLDVGVLISNSRQAARRVRHWARCASLSPSSSDVSRRRRPDSAAARTRTQALLNRPSMPPSVGLETHSSWGRSPRARERHPGASRPTPANPAGAMLPRGQGPGMEQFVPLLGAELLQPAVQSASHCGSRRIDVPLRAWKLRGFAEHLERSLGFGAPQIFERDQVVLPSSPSFKDPYRASSDFKCPAAFSGSACSNRIRAADFSRLAAAGHWPVCTAVGRRISAACSTSGNASSAADSSRSSEPICGSSPRPFRLAGSHESPARAFRRPGRPPSPAEQEQNQRGNFLIVFLYCPPRIQSYPIIVVRGGEIPHDILAGNRETGIGRQPKARAKWREAEDSCHMAA